MLTGIKLPLGMMGSSSVSMGPGALLFAALRVRVRVFSTFLSFFGGTVPGFWLNRRKLV